MITYAVEAGESEWAYSSLPDDDAEAGYNYLCTELLDVMTLEGSVNARNHLGGTAPEQVLAAVAKRRGEIDAR